MKIYATSDIHAYNIHSIESIKEDKNSILIDNGDFFMGSVQATYWNHHEAINPMITLANSMHYDVMVPGNHDFDYGLESYIDLTKSLNAQIVSCNIFDLKGQLIFKPYTILEREGKRYGVVGAMTSTFSQQTLFENSKDIIVKNAPDEIEKTVHLIRDAVDYIILSYHGGIEADLETGNPTQYPTKEDQAYEIASTIQGIDLLLCGHQHRENQGRVKDTLVVQIPEHLKKISCVDLDSKTNHWIIPNKLDNLNVDSWMEQKVDLSHLDAFSKKFIQSDLTVIQLEGDRIKDLHKGLTQGYPLRQYQLPIEEVIQYDWFKEDSKLDSYTVTTNLPLDFSRMKSYTVQNVFDAYYHYLQKKD